MPFEQALPWSGAWDDLPAAHGAAIAFDLLVIGGLLLLGRRLRPGREGLALGVALAYAWTAYPYTAVRRSSRTPTTRSSRSPAWRALLALTLRPRAAAVAGGVALGLGAAAKFVPLALAPLFARRRAARLRRRAGA